jgi:hypothetical protein
MIYNHVMPIKRGRPQHNHSDSPELFFINPSNRYRVEKYRVAEAKQQLELAELIGDWNAIARKARKYANACERFARASALRGRLTEPDNLALDRV